MTGVKSELRYESSKPLYSKGFVRRDRASSGEDTSVTSGMMFPGIFCASDASLIVLGQKDCVVQEANGNFPAEGLYIYKNYSSAQPHSADNKTT